MFGEKLLTLHCSSILAPYMADFVEQKRALGNKYNACVEVFNAFDSFCNSYGLDSPTISKGLLALWEEKRPQENETTQFNRISYVRALCRYMYNNGYDVPKDFHPAPKRSTEFVPYIFTNDELERFFAATDKTEPSSPSLRHLIMPVLFRLIYTCGLRVSEAVHLKVSDVDLDQGVMTIYKSKGNKDRMVGISDSMLIYMKNYRNHPLIKESTAMYFFPSTDGGFYDTSTIYEYFRRYLFAAGIPHRGRGKGPRVHDLRHSFAVHMLNKWASEGKDLYTCLPILQMYMGHSRITATEKYLRLIPDAYGELTGPFKNRFKEITDELDENKDL